MVTPQLSPEDERTIEQAVLRIERASASEVVVAVLDRSADHWHGRVLLAGCWAVGSALALLHWLPSLGTLACVVLQVPLAGLYFALLGVPMLHRWLIAPAAAEQAVFSRACAIFAERGVYRTRGRTGLLILVSFLERRVVVRGDEGLDAVVGSAGWDAIVARLTARFKQGEAARGLLEALSELEPSLVQAAPPREDDVNELPDQIVKR